MLIGLLHWFPFSCTLWCYTQHLAQQTRTLSLLPACFWPAMTRCQLLLLYPLPPFNLFTTAKTAKYIIRSLIAVTLTRPSTPIPPDSLQCCSPSLPLLLSGLLAWALSRFEVALFIQPARDVVVRGGVKCGAALFRCPKCQGLTSVKDKLCFSVKVIWTIVAAPITADTDYKVLKVHQNAQQYLQCMKHPSTVVAALWHSIN